MQTVKQQAFMRKALVLAAILIVGVILLLPAGRAAYAAENADTQDGAAVQSPLMAESLISASIPTPTGYNLSNFQVYSDYFEVFVMTDYYLTMYNMGIMYRPAGGEWSYGGDVGAVSKATIGGLKPNTKYEVKFFYYQTSYYSGTTMGIPSESVFFKTGPRKKPAIKSVKVKLINVKKHYQKVYGYYTGVYLGKRAYYTYKIRTTVTLKKKPKTKYFNLNGKWYKGNKKKYTFTTGKKIWWYTSPRGQKYTVSAYTAQSKVWGGYSLLYQKTKKAR